MNLFLHYHGFEFVGGLEDRGQPGRYLDRLGGAPGVAGQPGLALLDLEAPESPDLDVLPLGQRLHDGIQKRINDDLGVALGKTGFVADYLHQVGLSHGISSFWCAVWIL